MLLQQQHCVSISFTVSLSCTRTPVIPKPSGKVYLHDMTFAQGRDCPVICLRLCPSIEQQGTVLWNSAGAFILFVFASLGLALTHLSCPL